MNDFMKFCASHGLIVNRIEIGKITRCGTTDKPRSDNGAFLFDGIIGWAQNWAIHDSPILYKSDKKPDFIDYEQLRKKRDENIKLSIAEKSLNQTKAALKAKELISQAELNLSVYLASKGFPDMSTLVINSDEGQRMIVPMYFQNKICGAQVIHQDGKKRFIFGQRTSLAYFKIGDGSQVFFVEGYVSAISLQVILSKISIAYTILVTFSAGNMLKLAELHRSAIIIGDHDISGTSQNVAANSGLRSWFPDTLGDDINDAHVRQGIFTISQQLKKIIYTR